MRGSAVTAEVAADSPRGQARQIPAFQQNAIIDGHGDDLESSRGFKCLDRTRLRLIFSCFPGSEKYSVSKTHLKI